MQNSIPFQVYDASAGSGKTFTLVKNYLVRLLLSKDRVPYRHMLAITFTNKAVAEMKSRIIKSLSDFQQENTPPASAAMFEEVCRATEMKAAEVKEKSKKQLNNILHNYAAFEVTTIDSFNQRIIRTFAKDLDIPVNFEVEIDADEVLEEAVNRVLSRAGKEKILTQALIDFSIGKADDDKSWDISNDLNDIAKLLINENNFAPLEQLKDKQLTDFAEFEEKLTKKIKTCKENAREKSDLFFKLIAENNLSPGNFTRKSVPNFFADIAKVPVEKLLKRTHSKWALGIETKSLYKKDEQADKKQTLEEIQPQIAQLFKATVNQLYGIEKCQLLLKNNPALSLLSAIEEEVEEIKANRGFILISEFNKKIGDSIKNQPAPFIYERLGERYHTFYIDEFQDTSALQWHNIQPLIDHSLSAGTGKLTLVGDAKQSIYRWRGGKAEQFMALCGERNPFYVKKEVVKLPDNYRSAAAIVNFNNEFFKHAARFLHYEPYEKLYKTARQNPTKKTEGYVNIRFVEAQNMEEKNEQYPQEVLKILEQLKGQLSEDQAKQQNLHLNGVCVLVRQRKQGVIVADYLSKQGIPIISSETLLLKKSKEVNFLIALIQFSLHPTHKDYKFELLNFLCNHLNSTTNQHQFIQARIDLDGQDFFTSFSDLYFDLHQFRILPIYDAMEYALRSFHLLEEADAYLQFFLDFVYDYTQTHMGGLPGLLELWERKKDKLSITAPEGQNAVQIMTIHKAKGLEFPVVIYPYANEKLDDTKRSHLWVELEEEYSQGIPIAYLGAKKELANMDENIAVAYNTLVRQTELDAMNVAYVAMTRAQKQLYILSAAELDKKGREKENLFSGLLISFLKKSDYWREDQLQYEIGNRPAPELVVEKESETEEEQTTSTNFSWSSRGNRSLDILTKSGTFWGSVQEKAITAGNIIHHLLMDIHHKEDLNNAISQAINTGVIQTEEKDKYANRLLKVIQHPQLAKYFTTNYTIYTEKEIITRHEIKRLDRLCIHNQQAVIIDYKTGAPSKAHEHQMHTYAEAIREMGYALEAIILVYLTKDDPKIKLLT